MCPSDDGTLVWEPAEPGVAGEWDCYYAGGAPWLLSSDREASLARQEATTIRFVDCSASWHVEIMEGNTFSCSSQAINVIIRNPGISPQQLITWEQGGLFDPCWHCTVTSWETHSEGISSSNGLAPNVEILHRSPPPPGAADSFTVRQHSQDEPDIEIWSHPVVLGSTRCLL